MRGFGQVVFFVQMLCGSGEKIVFQKNEQVSSGTLMEETIILDSRILFFMRGKTIEVKGERQKEKWIIYDTTEHSEWGCLCTTKKKSNVKAKY